jgi:hypothetical protein
MSSRSLAAARSRRAGENVPPVSGNRPGTSIGSHAAFAPQQQQQQQQPNNVRVSKSNSQPPSNSYQQVKQSQQQTQNALPFNKISISDAIGLITLRLGRVEQWVIETEHENDINPNQNSSTSSTTLDNTIFTNIISRLDSIEKKEPGTATDLEQMTRICDEITKHNLAIAKHAEQMLRFERELVETKDILKTFMIKYDYFNKETNDKFSDFECALSEIEKNVTVETDINIVETGTTILQDSIIENIMTIDLKNIIENELAASTTD